MESNNIIAAPGFTDTNMLYEYWRRNHYGSETVFFEFMTKPSLERSEFIASLREQPKVVPLGEVIFVELQPTC